MSGHNFPFGAGNQQIIPKLDKSKRIAEKHKHLTSEKLIQRLKKNEGRNLGFHFTSIL